MFTKPRQSEDQVNIGSHYDESDTETTSRMPRYTTLSNRRGDVNTSVHSKDQSDISALPDIILQRDSVAATTRSGGRRHPQSQADLEYLANMAKLTKIRNSVRSVDQFNPIKRKRLYQGIVIISKHEFFIDIFRTKTKFYISAIELGNKKPYMIELYLNQGKKLLKE